MNRKRKALLHINQRGQGLEIGPSHNPIAPKKDGYNVHIIDHACREDLIAKYKNQQVNLDNIEEVDFVWCGESYSELTGKSKCARVSCSCQLFFQFFRQFQRCSC